MKKPLKQIGIFLMLIGVLGVALNIILGSNTVQLITKETNEFTGITYYKYNFSQYFNNLALNIGQIGNMQITKPTRQFNSEIINNLAVIADYLIMILNIIVYPIRIGAYIVSIIFAVLGVEYQPNGNNNWLVLFIRQITYIAIPYI